MTQPLRILLTGKNGQVGFELGRLLLSLGEVAAVGRGELDMAKPAEIRRVIAQSRPNVIINAAAYTAVDQAETEEALARTINAEAPAVIAEAAKRLGALVVHYSTDYVFDGAKGEPYVETDPTNPLNAYGRTKVAGEDAIRGSGAAYLILRTSWVYATRGKNFLLTILRLAATREELRIVNDQCGAPTSAREIAEATARILLSGGSLSQAEPRGEILADLGGTYHLTAGGETTWYEFARAILEACSGVSPEVPWFAAATAERPLVAKRIIPITTHDYLLPARRPAYSILSNDRFASVFRFRLADWRSQLAVVMGLK